MFTLLSSACKDANTWGCRPMCVFNMRSCTSFLVLRMRHALVMETTIWSRCIERCSANFSSDARLEFTLERLDKLRSVSLKLICSRMGIDSEFQKLRMADKALVICS